VRCVVEVFQPPPYPNVQPRSSACGFRHESCICDLFCRADIPEDQLSDYLAAVRVDLGLQGTPRVSYCVDSVAFVELDIVIGSSTVPLSIALGRPLVA
jgi:hypothetical protein